MRLAADAMQQPCTRLETVSGPALRLRGVVADPKERQSLLQQISAAAANATARIDVLPPGSPACHTLDTLNRATQPAPVSMVSLEPTSDCASCNRSVQDLRLVEGDRLVLHAQIPADRKFLVVDYMMADGNVYHAFPPPTPGADEIDGASYTTPWPFGKDVWVGDHREPAFPRTLSIGEPYGREMIVAVVSDAPLFDATRPAIEGQAAYLSALEAALKKAQGRDGKQPLASVVAFQTAAK